MRTIVKGREPASLRKHREAGGTYADYRETDDARHALLHEQGHICCYCMRRIQLRSMKIEHWDSQSDHPEKTTHWRNLLGACPGGDGDREAEKHCDTAKGDTPIKVNPVDKKQHCERCIQYLANGEIRSDDPEIQNDLNVTLNLNNEYLRRRRGQILDILKSRLDRKEDGFWKPEMLENELLQWERRDKEGMFREYCQVAIYFLQKLLKKRRKV